MPRSLRPTDWWSAISGKGHSAQNGTLSHRGWFAAHSHAAHVMLQVLAWILFFLVLLLFGAQIAAAEPTFDAQASSDSPSREIPELIQALDAAEFEAREAATRELIAQGAASVQAVSQSASSDNLEVATRSTAILRELFRTSRDYDVRASAREALAVLAAGPNPAAARRADAILNPPVIKSSRIRTPNENEVRKAIQQIAVATQVNVVEFGGLTTVRIVGPNGRVTFSHRKGREIVLSVQEFGEDDTLGPAVVHRAKNLDDLRENHPDAYRLFDRHGGVEAARLVREEAAAEFARQHTLREAAAVESARAERVRVEVAYTEFQALARKLQFLSEKENPTPEELQEAAAALRTAADRLKAVPGLVARAGQGTPTAGRSHK